MTDTQTHITDCIREALVRCETYLVNTERADDPGVIVGNHADLLRSVRFAVAVLDKPYADCDEIEAVLGSRNWCIARRSPRIVARYGADVITLSPARYAEVEQRALALRAAAL